MNSFAGVNLSNAPVPLGIYLSIPGTVLPPETPNKRLPSSQEARAGEDTTTSQPTNRYRGKKNKYFGCAESQRILIPGARIVGVLLQHQHVSGHNGRDYSKNPSLRREHNNRAWHSPLSYFSVYSHPGNSTHYSTCTGNEDPSSNITAQ